MRSRARVSRWLPLVALGLALAAAAPPASAQEELPGPERYHLRLEYLWWSPEPAGQLQKGVSDREGTLLGVDELGIVSRRRTNELRAALRLGTAWKLRASWSPLDFRGDVAAGRDFSYGTTDVALGQRAITTLKGNYGTAELEWDFLERQQGFLGLLLGAKIVDVDTLLLNVDSQERVAETERLPIPSVGLTARLYPDRRLSLEGDLSGLTIGNRGHIWELHAAARFHVSDHLAATGGYHRIALEGHTDRDFLKLELGRWTFGVEISL